MSEKAFYAERNYARKERTLNRKQARRNKADTIRQFTAQPRKAN